MSERSYLHSSYYHTLIFYPGDYMTRASPVPLIGKEFNFISLLQDIFYKIDCEFLISPYHTPDGVDLKPHFHILFRASRKMSGNAFQMLLCEALDNDFTGFAYSPKVGVVTKFDRYIRYMIHLDNPGKQQFENGFYEIKGVGNWSKEIYKAFEEEILKELFLLVSNGYSINEICENDLYRYALTQGRNLYLMNTLRNGFLKDFYKGGN